VVPADGEVTSQSAIGGNAYHGPAAFVTTHWSVVLEAQGESPAAHEALEKLCRIYWRPIYSFVIFDADGNLIVTVCARSTATRFE
jgi:hypothetical protein